MRSFVFAACFCVALAAAGINPGSNAENRHVLFNRAGTPFMWTKGGRADQDAKVGFTLAVRQQNLEELDRIFWAVSTPNSPEYRNFRSSKEIASLVASSDEDMAAVKQFVMSVDGVSCESFSDAMMCTAPVSAVEQLFQTTFYEYTHLESGKRIVRQEGEYSVPVELKGIVELVSGISNFPSPRFGRKNSGKVEGTDYVVVPETITNFYSLQGASGSKKNIQSAIEFQNYPPYSKSDLDTFEKDVNSPHFDIEKKIGPFPQGVGVESTLDVQYLGAVGAGNTNWYWTEEQWMYEFALKLSNTDPAPNVVSMSYGWDEAQQCRIDPTVCNQQGFDSKAFVKRVNSEFQKIGTKGISLVASAGDAGAHGRTDEYCFSPKMNPTYPAASPYVTAVGATQIKDGKSDGANAPICQNQLQCATGGVEVVASSGTGALITTGGGFSNYAQRPSYQDDAVNSYLQNSSAIPPTSDFNPQGRGYPDVAALGHNYFIYDQGQVSRVDGTSCSAPVFSGVVGMLNGYLMENGQKPLGFLNPFLYEMAAKESNTFNDITVGNNKCTEQSCCDTGFSAAPGWDATTGLGTPNYANMLKYVKNKFGLN